MKNISHLERLLIFFIFALLFLGLVNSLYIGASWDGPFHHTNGMNRLKYIITLGVFENYDFSNIRFYPGFYDTLSAGIYYLIEKTNTTFAINYTIEIKHLTNYLFFCLSILGLYKVTSLFLNNKLFALITCLLTTLSPQFFGHSAINSKDTIIYFSLIWFIYFFIKYLLIKDNFKNLFFFSLFVGFGCGIRLSFISLVFPFIILGIFYYCKNEKISLFNFFRKKIYHLIISFFIIIIITLSAWPHLHSFNYNLILETILRTRDWAGGPQLNLINGAYYRPDENQINYLISLFAFRFPYYQTALIILSLYLCIFKKKYLIEECKNLINFALINLLFIAYVFIVLIFLKVKIYDGARLIIFVIPFLCTLSSVSIFYIIKYFHKKNITILFISFFIFILFGVSMKRFFSLNPYQYTYLNLTTINLDQRKFENDYWNTSFKELIYKIPNSIDGKNVENIKFHICGGDSDVAFYYLSKKFKNIKLAQSLRDADYVIQTNRASFNPKDKRTCFDAYIGKDVLYVKRNGMILSKVTKIK